MRVIDIETDMFPGKINEYVKLPPHISVTHRKFRSEKFLIQALKTFNILSPLSGGRVARYGSSELKKQNSVISSYKTISCKDIAHLPLQAVDIGIDEPFNSVHIRRTDNVRAIKGNPISKFIDFIEKSSLSVYVASDCEDTKSALKERFPKKVLLRTVGLQRGSSADLDDAFRELWCLILSREFLPSRGSSFSAIAEAHRAKLRSVYV